MVLPVDQCVEHQDEIQTCMVQEAKKPSTYPYNVLVFML